MYYPAVFRGGQCRFPHGKRGLKYAGSVHFRLGLVSLPPREAWIEIMLHPEESGQPGGRFPHGKRGLKYAGPGFRRRKSTVASPTGSVD